MTKIPSLPYPQIIRALQRDGHLPYLRINKLFAERRGTTPSTVLRLVKFFNISPAFWLNLQLRWDLYHAQKGEAKALSSIPRCLPELTPRMAKA